MAFLLNAKNLVISHSTLTNAIAVLSSKLENVYMFNQTRFEYINSYNCQPTEEYYNRILRDWKNNRTQRYLMLNSPSCIRWDYYPKME